MSQTNPDQANSSGLSQTHAKTILVVEDERATRTSLLSFLRDQGFRVLGAENGLIGVQLAQEHHPDLIICDIIMPELDGYDVLRTLKQNPATAEIPLIFLTMTATVEGCQQSLAMGANDYLAKPVSSDQLRRAIAAQFAPIPAAPLRSELKHLPNLSPLPSRLSSGELGLSYLEQSPYIPTADLLELSPEELQGLLIERFCQVLLQRLTILQSQVNDLQEDTELSEQLQQGCSQLLALTDEVVTLQTMLTPENVAIWLDHLTEDAAS
jgi:two-component system, OmpR family, alkaline phosphatase synthesis response regulator PhoP